MAKILFVCTGNICRSSAAEAVMRHKKDQKDPSNQHHIASAGTHGYHVGNPPDIRGILAAKQRGVSMDGMTAQKFEVADFNEYDHIIAMDRGHMQYLNDLKPSANITAQLSLFMDYIPNALTKDVPDPYYGDDQGFEDVLDIVEQGLDGLVKYLT